MRKSQKRLNVMKNRSSVFTDSFIVSYLHLIWVIEFQLFLQQHKKDYENVANSQAKVFWPTFPREAFVLWHCQWSERHHIICQAWQIRIKMTTNQCCVWTNLLKARHKYQITNKNTIKFNTHKSWPSSKYSNKAKRPFST